MRTRLVGCLAVLLLSAPAWADESPDPGPIVQDCTPANKAVPGGPSWGWWLINDKSYTDCRYTLARTQLDHNACWSYVAEKLWPEVRDLYPAPEVFDVRTPLPYETGCGGVAYSEYLLCAQTLAGEQARLANCGLTRSLLGG